MTVKSLGAPEPPPVELLLELLLEPMLPVELLLELLLELPPPAHVPPIEESVL